MQSLHDADQKRRHAALRAHTQGENKMLKKDLLTIIRTPGAWISFLALAVLMTLSLIIPKDNGETEAVISIGISDNDGSEYSKLLLGFFDQNEVFLSYVNMTVGTDEEIDALFRKGELDMTLSIPENFAENLIHINNSPVIARIDASDKTKSVMLSNLLEAYGKYISASEINCQSLYDVMKIDGYDREIRNEYNNSVSYDLVLTALSKDTFFERYELERLQSIPLTKYYAYSVLFIIILFGGLFAGLNLLNEHRSGALARLKSTGMSMFSVVFGKYAFFFISYGLLAIYTIFAFSLSTFFITLVFIPVVIGFFLVLSDCIRTTKSYLLAGNLLLLIFTILGGGIIPIMYMPVSLSRLAYITPNYWFLRVMLSIENGSQSINVPVLCGILAAITAVLFVIAASGLKRREARVSDRA